MKLSFLTVNDTADLSLFFWYSFKTISNLEVYNQEFPD